MLSPSLLHYRSQSKPKPYINKNLLMMRPWRGFEKCHNTYMPTEPLEVLEPLPYMRPSQGDVRNDWNMIGIWLNVKKCVFLLCRSCTCALQAICIQACRRQSNLMILFIEYIVNSYMVLKIFELRLYSGNSLYIIWNMRSMVKRNRSIVLHTIYISVHRMCGSRSIAHTLCCVFHHRH